MFAAVAHIDLHATRQRSQQEAHTHDIFSDYAACRHRLGLLCRDVRLPPPSPKQVATPAGVSQGGRTHGGAVVRLDGRTR